MPSTFTIIPNIEINEEWSWKTNILRTINGKEYRLSLRPRPRIKISGTFGPFNWAGYREFFEVIQANIKNVFDTPIWPYNGPITLATSSGGNRVYFDPSLVPVSVGGVLILVNPRLGVVESHVVSTVNSDGATLSTNVTQDITTGFIACLGMKAVIEDGASINLSQITGTAKIDFRSWIDPEFERPGTAASLDTFDDITILERRFSAETEFAFTFEKEIIDFEVGLRFLRSGISHSEIDVKLVFIADRVLVSSDFDYWRKFFNTIKGSWKPFLLCTNSEDLTLYTTLTQNGTEIVFNEPAIEAEDDAFSRIRITYSDGTESEHVLSARTVEAGPSYSFTVTPNIPNDPKVTSVSKISYLLKMRAADIVQLSHGHLRTVISFDARTTDDG